jgi:hypothetical protein
MESRLSDSDTLRETAYQYLPNDECCDDMCGCICENDIILSGVLTDVPNLRFGFCG